MLRLYDTATREVRELAQREPGKVSIYLCGPTVYGPPHLGHGRQTLVYDVLVRYLRWSGVDVRLVSNITDIDDQIINRANAEGRAVAGHHDEVRGGVVRRPGPPRRRPARRHPARHRVRRRDGRDDRPARRDRPRLHDRRRRLPVGARRSRTTACSPTSRSTTCSPAAASARSSAPSCKRHPADFVLWKLAKPGEPSWPSPWGEGRPGWHSECVVMSLDLLGEGFDLHCGGMDLRFPHHENERAQAVALGKRFANHWMHHAFVVDAEGEKMSKSLGNVDNLLDLLDRYDERTYRMLLLQSHYRSPVRVGTDSLQGAERALAGLDSFAAAQPRRPTATPTPTCWPRSRRRWTTTSTRRRRWPSCSTPSAGPTPRSTPGDPRPAPLVAAVRGDGRAPSGSSSAAPTRCRPTSLERAAALDAARAAKDYATADAIRAELQADGWIVETTAAGTTVRR